MPGFKLTTWNVEHADKTLSDFEGTGGHSTAASAERARDRAIARMAAIRREIEEIDPDILFVCEGPRGEDRATRYFAQAAPGYRVVTRNDAAGRSYGIKGGSQWLWFLVKQNFPATCSLLPIVTWQAFTRDASQGRHDCGKWHCSMPTLDRDKTQTDPVDPGRQGPSLLVQHDHYRHPQVLACDWNGTRFEVIGVHMKSKFVNQRLAWLRWQDPRDAAGTPSSAYEDILASIAASPGFMVESVRNRAKLSSEASDIRYYIDRRFAQEGDPAIFLVGDINDGPGKELIEDWYLLHDLIGNLQGEVFSAHKFLNHALFDIADDLRWTVHFEDAIDRRRDPHILLDHVLFTQRLAGSGKPPLRVFPNAGRVEHDIHERVASTLPGGVTTSDHRPVSVHVTEVDQDGAPTAP